MITGEAIQAKAAERIPAEPNGQVVNEQSPVIQQSGFNVMELLGNYWYIPAGLAALVFGLKVFKKK